MAASTLLTPTNGTDTVRNSSYPAAEIISSKCVTLTSAFLSSITLLLHSCTGGTRFQIWAVLTAALGKEHIYDANAKYRNEGRREKWVRSFTTDCLTTRDNDTNQNISASIQSANRHDEETRIYHFAAHQICSKHLFCHIPFCYLLLVRFIRLYTFSEMYFLYRHHSWIMPLMDSSSLSW
mgnify:CR=1 FL=1